MLITFIMVIMAQYAQLNIYIVQKNKITLEAKLAWLKIEVG